MVVHKASGRRMSYGEIAAFAKAPAELPKIEDKDLKPAASFRLIGKDVPRVELPTKVTGAAKYAIDVQVPGMVYAAVLQSPYPGGAPETVDDAAARKVPGITDVVRLPDGVARHRLHGRGNAGRQEAAQGHLVAMRRARTTTASARSKSLPRSAATRAARACPTRPRRRRQGARWQGAAKVFRGDYRTRYVYHAQMEPLSATASVSADGKSAEIWAGTQGADRACSTRSRGCCRPTARSSRSISTCSAAASAAAGSRR